MSTAYACLDADHSSFFSMPSGLVFDQESRSILYSKLRDAIRSLWYDETISRGAHLLEAEEALLQIYRECSGPRWDAYDAEPISVAAINEARIIIHKLISAFEMPEIVPEANGGIGLEWRMGKEKALVLVVTGKRRIEYAGIFGSGKVHGSEYFEGILPAPFIGLLRRLYS